MQREKAGAPLLAPASSDSDSTDYSVLPWRRRRSASFRLTQLACGCRDPWGHRCTREAEPLSDHQLDAWMAAIGHLRAHDLSPILPSEWDVQ
jgi:hypothetical protein